jgi:hypothetical protein
MFRENGIFGHNQIISNYCSLEATKPIFGTFPHGWTIRLNPSNRKLPIAPRYLWNMRNLNQAYDFGIKNVKCIGAPFAYLIRMLWPNDTYPNGRGTIIYPELENWSKAYRDYAFELVKEVENNYAGPYTVSLRSSEIKFDVIKFWREFNWNITTNGARNNKYFLYQQAFELVKHENAVGNEIQTSLVYAAALKRNICVLGPSIYRGNNNPYDIQNWEKYFQFNRKEHIPGITANYFGKHEIGYDQTLNRGDLMEELGFNSKSKQMLAKSVHTLHAYFTPEWFLN